MSCQGSCLCNSVKYSFEPKEKCFDACHCSMCRRWSGGVLFGVVANGDIKYHGIESLKVFKSSEWAERGFCQNCGTNLFYRLRDQSVTVFCLGSIEQKDEFEFEGQIYVDNKPKNYDFSNKTKMLTEAQVLEMFNAS